MSDRTDENRPDQGSLTRLRGAPDLQNPEEDEALARSLEAENMEIAGQARPWRRTTYRPRGHRG